MFAILITMFVVLFVVTKLTYLEDPFFSIHRPRASLILRGSLVLTAAALFLVTVVYGFAFLWKHLP